MRPYSLVDEFIEFLEANKFTVEPPNTDGRMKFSGSILYYKLQEFFEEVYEDAFEVGIIEERDG